MHKTITPADMRVLEGQYMAEHGVPGALLMEHAAQGVCQALQRRCPGGKALFLCGPGNNGGDGYAAARIWKMMGGHSCVIELTVACKGDAAMNRRLCVQDEISLTTGMPPSGHLPHCDVIVDALFGTGLSKPVSGPAAGLIHLANLSGKPIVAVDIPSGLDGTTGKPTGPCIHADETVTFHRIKQGLLLGDGPRYTGNITVQSILIPRDYGDASGMNCMTPDDLAAFIPARDPFAHKGTFGKAVIFAGSPGMAGAAAFAANACIKTGAGLTTLVCDERILTTVQMLAPGAVCIPADLSSGTLHEEDSLRIRQAIDSATVIAAGCGWGTKGVQTEILQMFLETDCPLVLDADALNALGSHACMLQQHRNTFITPHPGEAARLLGCSTKQVTDDPLTALTRLHELTGGSVLLKGARTLMSDGERLAVNRFGTPAMAKGGSGDVLTGILTGLLAQCPQCPPLLTLQLAALIHGLAGIRAEKARGENCVTPQNLIEHIRLDQLEL